MPVHPKQLRISDFTYLLPAERIALYPLAQRDASKLLLYREGTIREDHFNHLAGHLPADTLLVFNNTRVVPARLLFQKPTGGQIEIFVLEPVANGEISSAMAASGSIDYLCLVKGAVKWKSGLLTKTVADGTVLTAELISRTAEGFRIRFQWTPESISFAEVLQRSGEMPIPPYLHRAAAAEDQERYQTIYARYEGSVAAPTAGLHFTDTVLESLRSKGIAEAYTTLHVGAGTFKPVKAEQLDGHDMHAEWISVEKELLYRLMQHETVIPVGTTSLRTLESLYWMGLKTMKQPGLLPEALTITQWEVYEQPEDSHPTKQEALQALVRWMEQHQLQTLVTRTQILIAPGYRFRICEGLITNFHQPQSTLLLLIAALIGPGWKQVYEYALDNGFRFLSYGDSSLLFKS